MKPRPWGGRFTLAGLRFRGNSSETVKCRGLGGSELIDDQRVPGLGLFFDSIEDEGDAPSQQPSPKDGRPQFDQLDIPDWFFREHKIADPALNHDDSERH